MRSCMRRWCYTRRFATTIFRVKILEQCYVTSKKCRIKVTLLCCAENRRCEFSHITSPLFLNFTPEVTSPLELNDNELEQESRLKPWNCLGSPNMIGQVFCTPICSRRAPSFEDKEKPLQFSHFIDIENAVGPFILDEKGTGCWAWSPWKPSLTPCRLEPWLYTYGPSCSKAD